MARQYRYVGPEEIAERCRTLAPGTVIHDRESLAAWLRTSTESIFTYVIDEHGYLRLAPRQSEHVACAGGRPVLSAGEIGFDRANLAIVHVTNLSTGYCPEPESWHSVEATLRQLQIEVPPRWTREYTFRKCPNCGERNLVKDDWFVCELCDAALPRDWNFSR